MKSFRSFFVRALFIMSSTCLLIYCSEKNKTSLSKIGLKGKVKSLIETDYEGIDRFGEVQKSNIMNKSISLYNSMGNLIDYKTYDSNGNQTYHGTYSYNNQEHMIESNSYNNLGRRNSKTVFTYDEKGYLAERKAYDQDGNIKTISRITNDRDGNIIQEISYSKDGSIAGKTQNKYDRDGNKIEVIDYRADGSILYTSNTKYNADGKRIELRMSIPSLKSNSEDTFKYDNIDKKGNWLLCIRTGESEIIVSERDIEYY